jgi:hypothetical protein
MEIVLFVYPLISLATFGLFLHFGCYEQYFREHFVQIKSIHMCDIILNMQIFPHYIKIFLIMWAVFLSLFVYFYFNYN